MNGTTRILLHHSRWLIVLAHLPLLAGIYYVSFLVRFDFLLPANYYLLFWLTVPVILAVKVPVFEAAGLFRGWWRYAGISDLLNICRASVIASGLMYIVESLAFRDKACPRSVLLIDLVLTICIVGGLRLSVRLYQETSGRRVARKNTLIVGAGQAGNKIARELKNNPDLDLNPVAYVDDDITKQNISIQGLRVLGRIADIPRIVDRYRISCVLVAMPSVNGSALQSILAHCRQCTAELRILPPLGERINGTPAISTLRRVRIEDLLGRPPVSLDMASIRQKLAHKVLMITGAGGSIGSELTRQLAAFGPGKLVLFERSENDLHKIDVELHSRYPELSYVPVVGDILDVRTLRETIAEHRPQSIFHAAAYKHVPMMEKNCFQAVVNNIFGTYNVALVAKQYGVEDFLMISSDKAVNPTNIMGVTKRVAELVILGLQHQHTRYVSVRFGNVLGSNGSVLPLFQQQVAQGGPLTVTHPDAQRYFMTIPEAVQLVLQASTMGKGGEIFVLNMGSPLKIVELARNLIRLSGLTPDKDIEIVFTGLRPGEKLVEELQLHGEGIKPTSHNQIRVLDGGNVDFLAVMRWLDELSTVVSSKNVYGLVRTLKNIVPEYVPSAELVSLGTLDRHDRLSAYQRARSELLSSTEMESIVQTHSVL